MPKKPKEKKTSKRSLNPLREQLQILVNQANQRISRLNKAGMGSRALFEAQRSFKRMTSRDESEGLFKSDLKTRRQIMREFSRVNEFLNDYTSTVTGAKKVAALDLKDLKGAFGANWHDTYGVNYDKSRINEEDAQIAFKLYRMIQEEYSWERVAGIYKGRESLVGYGSEVLITNIYDMVIAGHKQGDILKTARQIVESAEKRYAQMAMNQVADYDYGKLFPDENEKNRREYYINNWEWRKERKKRK